MRARYVVSALSALSLLSVPPALAQDPSTPEAVAVSFGEALKARDWAAAARLMHPGALGQIRGLGEVMFRADSSGNVSAQFFGTGSAAEFAAMPDTVLFARFLQHSMVREGLDSVMQYSTLTPLGHLSQPGDTAFVVTRVSIEMAGMKVTSFEVIPMLKWQGAWRELLKADMSNMITMLRRELGVATD
jgi:hypothetical protein